MDDSDDDRVPSAEARLPLPVTDRLNTDAKPVNAVRPRPAPDRSDRQALRRRTRSQHRGPTVVAVTAVLVAVSLILPGGRHQWAVSLFRQPTRYTVLAFTDPANLPDRARPGESLTVAFTISNYEGRALTYRYVLSEDSRGDHKVLGTSARSLAAGRTAAVVITVRPSCRTSPCRIEVSLPDHPETIDFLVSLVTQRPSSVRRSRHSVLGHQAPAGSGGGLHDQIR